MKGRNISIALANKVSKKKANKQNKTQNAAVGHLLRSKKVSAILNKKIMTPTEVVTRPGKKRASSAQASAVTPGEKKPVSPAKEPKYGKNAKRKGSGEEEEGKDGGEEGKMKVQTRIDLSQQQ